MAPSKVLKRVIVSLLTVDLFPSDQKLSIPLALPSFSTCYEISEFRGYGTPQKLSKNEQLPEILFAGTSREKPCVSLHSLTESTMNHVQTLELGSKFKFKNCIISMQLAKVSANKKCCKFMVMTDSKKLYLLARDLSGLTILNNFDLSKVSSGRGVKCFFLKGDWAIMWDEGEKGRIFEGHNWVVKLEEKHFQEKGWALKF